MPTSQNGYPAGDMTLIVSVGVPGTNVALPVRRGPTGALLVAAAARWHREVEPLMTPGCWGYAYRSVRGSTTELSNHASGTAVDLNAPKHPLGTDPSMNFTPAQVAAVRRIVDDSCGALRWGGDYGVPQRGGVQGSRPDGMHLEINADEAACAQVLPLVSKTPLPVGGAEVQLSDRVPDLYTDKPGDTLTVGDTIAWSAAHAAHARDAANAALAEVQALRKELAALRLALGK